MSEEGIKIMITVGLMSKAQIINLLQSFPVHPELVVRRSDSTITVHMKGEKILSAISHNGRQWSVRAKTGLITTK